MSASIHEDFPHTWSASVLATPPLISPARQFTYPLHVPGEEDAMQRGALLVQIKPASGASFLATAALGFRDANALSGLYACPSPDDLLILSGGYAYLVNTQKPESCEHLPLRPTTAIMAAPQDGLLLLAGFWSVIAVGAEGLRWKSERVSAEGVELQRVDNGVLHGTGWDYVSNKDVPFKMDLRTGKHEGGGFTSGGWRYTVHP